MTVKIKPWWLADAQRDRHYGMEGQWCQDKDDWCGAPENYGLCHVAGFHHALERFSEFCFHCGARVITKLS